MLAIGLVYIKGQERIQRRTLTNIPVTIEHVPPNWTLPENWTPARASLAIQGPRNTIELVRSDQSSFRVDLSSVHFSENGDPVVLLLGNEMFRTPLEPGDRSRISVVEDSIRPRQVKIQVQPWEMTAPQSPPENSDSNQILIPLYRIEKVVKIVTPTQGTPPERFVLKSLSVSPPSIRLTGPRDALDRIESVSTQALILDLIPPDTPPIYLPLDIPSGPYDIHPADSNVHGVTVTLTYSERK